MSKTKESFNAPQERNSESRLDGFRKDMDETGRGELADNLIAGLNNPEKPTLIIGPGGSGVEEGIRKLAESALDNPDGQFSTIYCHPKTSKTALLGYTDPQTGKHVPGAINGETKICLLEGIDRLPHHLEIELVTEVLPKHEGVAFYLTANHVEPTSGTGTYSYGVDKLTTMNKSRVYQMPPRTDGPTLEDYKAA